MLRDLIWFLVLQMGLATAGFAAGGVSGGGGGGTIIANPVSAQDVRAAIKESKLNLYLALNQLSHDVEQRHAANETVDPVLEKLFSNSENLYFLLRKSNIHVQLSRPCKDLQGNEYDGSAPFSKSDPLSICLSEKNLQSKLSRDNYRPQIVALLGHELSHLLGFSEPEATALQSILIDHLASYPIPVAPSSLRMSAYHSDVIMALTHELLKKLNGDEVITFSEIERMQKSAFLLGEAIISVTFNPALPSELMDYFYLILGKQYMMACAVDFPEVWPNDYLCKTAFPKIFGNEPLLLLKDFMKEAFSDNKVYAKEPLVIRKITSRNIFRIEATELYDAANKISSFLYITGKEFQKDLIFEQ